MSAVHTFSASLKHLKTLLILKLLERWVTYGILLGLVSVICLFITDRILHQDLRQFFIYAGSLAGAVVVAGIYAWFTKKRVLEELIEVDIRLKLAERLSTAFEFHSRGKDTVFSDILFQKASSIIERLNYHHIHRRQLFPGYFLIGVLLVMAIITHAPDFNQASQTQLAYTRTEHSKTADKIEAFIRKRFNGPKDLAEKKLDPVQQEVKKLIRMMKDPSIRTQETYEQLQRTLASVQASQTSKLNNLGDQLSFGNKSESRELKSLKNEKTTPNELKQLEEQLGKMFENGIPDSVSRDISSMRRQQALEDLLKESLEDLKRNPAGQDGEKGSAASEGEGVLISKSKPDQPYDENLSENERDKQVLGSTQEKPRQHGTNESLPSGTRPDENEHKNREGQKPPPGEQTSSVGKGKSDWQEKPDSALAKSKRSQEKVEGQSGQGSWYNTKIRSLTNVGDVKATKEQIRRSYERDMENTLLKEEIPLNMRSYIKNYFLSIGLRKDKK